MMTAADLLGSPFDKAMEHSRWKKLRLGPELPPARESLGG
jgi:hypothetical protein